MNRTRVTRTYWLGIPKYRTSYERPTNWKLFRPVDFVPFLILAVLNALLWRQIGDVLVALTAVYLMVLPVVGGLRMRRRRLTVCAEHGHTPWEPLPGEWECQLCGMPLERKVPEWVSVSAAQAASEVEQARRVSQARYSDRR